MKKGSFLFGKQEREHTLTPPERIAVAGAAAGSGASFVAGLLVFGLRALGSVSLTELGEAHFYDALAFEKRFLRGFTDFFSGLRQGAHFCGEKNIYEGINWIVRKSGDNDSLAPPELFRALYMPKEEYCVFDCSGLDAQSSLALLAEAEHQIAVIDPLPSSLSRSRDFLERLRLSLPEALIIVNKMNPGVHRAELEHFLGTKNYISLPLEPPQHIYKAEYNALPFPKLYNSGASVYAAGRLLAELFQ